MNRNIKKEIYKIKINNGSKCFASVSPLLSLSHRPGEGRIVASGSEKGEDLGRKVLR